LNDNPWEGKNYKLVQEFHSGAISEMAVSPKHNICVTMGQDGVAKLWDFINMKEIYSSKFIGSGTAIDWLPDSPANHGRVLVAGFNNGVVRVLQINRNEF